MTRDKEIEFQELITKLLLKQGVRYLELKLARNRYRDDNDWYYSEDHLICIVAATWQHAIVDNRLPWMAEFFNRSPKRIKELLAGHYSDVEMNDLWELYYEYLTDIREFFIPIYIQQLNNPTAEEIQQEIEISRKKVYQFSK